MEDNEKQPDEKTSFKAQMYENIGIFGFALTTIGIYVSPFSDDFSIHPFILGIGIAYGYTFVTFASLFISRLEKDSFLTLFLQIVSWAWLLYWLYFRDLVLPAFVGHLLFLGTIGRILWFYKLYEKIK